MMGVFREYSDSASRPVRKPSHEFEQPADDLAAAFGP
jgi:hypothetical protein